MRVGRFLARWGAAEMPGYHCQARNFENSIKDLICQARNKDVKRATLAHTQFMQSQLQCHTFVRDRKK
jgi:hypothetical protein